MGSIFNRFIYSKAKSKLTIEPSPNSEEGFSKIVLEAKKTVAEKNKELKTDKSSSNLTQ